MEHLVARLLFSLRRATGNRASFTAKFQREREKIGTLVRSFTADSAARRVLIERPPGLEDSSRDWSVWMTLEHLRIVHEQLVRIIGDLTKGSVPQGKASTAAVKPSPDVDAGVAGTYEESCDALLRTVAAASDLHTRLRFVHPWFGPLNAAGWFALAGGHMSIHRVQIERIKAGCAKD
jgi:hypothetical protein